MEKNWICQVNSDEEFHIVRKYLEDLEDGFFKESEHVNYIPFKDTGYTVYFIGFQNDDKIFYHSYLVNKYNKIISFEQFKQTYLKNMKQTLTRDQLLVLKEQFDCQDWIDGIYNILKLNLFSKEDEFEIDDKSLELLVQKGTEMQLDAVKMLGITLPKTVKDEYLEHHNKSDLKIGNSVKVLRSFTSYEKGCEINFNVSMNRYIGNVYKITEKSDKAFKLDHYWFPYFILEKVIEEYIPFDFTDDLVGIKIITKDKGCRQIITYQTEFIIKLGHIVLNYVELFNEYTFIDSNICGKLKQ